MSSTSRGKKLDTEEFYPTPGWVTRRLLEIGHFLEGVVLDPCAGDGAILRELREGAWDELAAVEIQGRFEKSLQEVAGCVSIGDALAMPWPDHSHVIMNPPFSLATEFVVRALDNTPGTVAMLQRLNWLECGGSKRTQLRRDVLDRWMPNVYVLPNRPNFQGKGSDSCAYAWFVWPLIGSGGRIELLPVTPKEERRCTTLTT